MDASHKASSLPPADAEEFFSTGEQAWPPASLMDGLRRLPEDGCCAAVDMPGVGKVHASGCAFSPTGADPAPARKARMGEVAKTFSLLPEPLRLHLQAFDHAGIGYHLARLVNASRVLAQRGIRYQYASRPDVEEKETVWSCCECHVTVVGRSELEHKHWCAAGRVLRIIEDLCAIHIDENAKVALDHAICSVCHGAAENGVLVHGAQCSVGFASVNTSGKETAQVEEIGPACDWKRTPDALPGFAEKACLKCGARGGSWTSQAMLGISPSLDVLGLNQCATVWAGKRGFTLYTHHCDSPDVESAQNLPLKQHVAEVATDSKAEDFGEPFRLDGQLLVTRAGEYVADGPGFLRRMVACMNFCQGATTEYLESRGGAE